MTEYNGNLILTLKDSQSPIYDDLKVVNGSVIITYGEVPQFIEGLIINGDYIVQQHTEKEVMFKYAKDNDYKTPKYTPHSVSGTYKLPIIFEIDKLPNSIGSLDLSSCHIKKSIPIDYPLETLKLGILKTKLVINNVTNLHLNRTNTDLLEVNKCSKFEFVNSHFKYSIDYNQIGSPESLKFESCKISSFSNFPNSIESFSILKTEIDDISGISSTSINSFVMDVTSTFPDFNNFPKYNSLIITPNLFKIDCSKFPKWTNLSMDNEHERRLLLHLLYNPTLQFSIRDIRFLYNLSKKLNDSNMLDVLEMLKFINFDFVYDKRGTKTILTLLKPLL